MAESNDEQAEGIKVWPEISKVGYRSRTSRGEHERDTQIIMVSLAACSSVVSTESRWSGIPSSTGVSQVPQVPSWQENSTGTPDSSTTSRMGRSAGTVSVVPVCARGQHPHPVRDPRRYRRHRHGTDRHRRRQRGNSIVVCPGANASLTSADVASAQSIISAAAVLSLVMEIPLDTVKAAARTAHDAGTRVLLNLSPVVELPENILALGDPLIVNEHEARQLLGRSEHAGEPAEIAAALRDLGARSAVVTLGSNGAAIADAHYHGHIPAVMVDPVDTTGAGDAFAATIAWRLSEGDAPR